MGATTPAGGTAKKNFFISYTGADQAWAEWIAWQIDSTGERIILQAWHFRPGHNFVQKMDEATKVCERTIAVLSPRYLESAFTEPEWQAAFARGSTGSQGLLLPVLVEDCGDGLQGLLRQIVHIDLVGLDEAPARAKLLAGINSAPAIPNVEPSFPGGRRPTTAATAPKPRFPGAMPRVCNLPPRNRNFAGREDAIGKVRESLAGGRAMAITAVHGLGGVGKSQLAVEYAYRFKADYDVIWFAETETAAARAASAGEFARALGLPEQGEREQAAVFAAVRRWLEEGDGWLLILDNAGNPQDLADMLPRGGGHVLITSRHHAWGASATPLDLDLWIRDESVAFLIARRPGESKAAADALAVALGDLPLALEQAAAYCEACGESFTGYRAVLESQDRAELLAIADDPGRAVAAVWRASFAALGEPAAQLLQLSAFLAPDAIPLDLIRGGRAHLPEPLATACASGLKFNQALADLLRFSLIRRAGEAISVHRLVQAVTRDRMAADERREWAARAAGIVSAALPEFPNNAFDATVAEVYDRLGAHALAAAGHAECCDVRAEAPGRVFSQIGFYRSMRGDYREARDCYERALAIDERVFGPDHPHVAIRVNNLGTVLLDQSDLEGAKRSFKRALDINERTFGPDHPKVARAVGNLGVALYNQGDLKGARARLERALDIAERAFDPDHPEVARVVGNLGLVLRDQGDLKGTHAHFERALDIDKRAFGPNHPDVAGDVRNLGLVLCDQGDLDGARACYERALRILEPVVPGHPNTRLFREDLARVEARIAKRDGGGPAPQIRPASGEDGSA